MRLMAVFVLLGIVGCSGGRGGGGDDDDVEIPGGTLGGRVGGQAWELVAGHTNAFLSEGEPDFFAELYGEDLEECGFGAPSASHVIVAIPKEPGEYDFSLQRNATFVIESDDAPENLLVTTGRVVVDEVTASEVRGSTAFSYDDDNDVGGEFVVTVCAE